MKKTHLALALTAGYLTTDYIRVRRFNKKMLINRKLRQELTTENIVLKRALTRMLNGTWTPDSPQNAMDEIKFAIIAENYT